MFDTPISQAGAAAMVLACICAILIGRWPERVAALTLAINWVACEDLEDRRYTRHPFHHLQVQPAIASIDVAYMLLLLVLLVCTQRRWIIYAFGLQTLIVGLHAATFADVRISHYDFFTAYYVASWGVVLSLGAGAALEGRRDPRPAARLSPAGPDATLSGLAPALEEWAAAGSSQFPAGRRPSRGAAEEALPTIERDAGTNLGRPGNGAGPSTPDHPSHP